MGKICKHLKGHLTLKTIFPLVMCFQLNFLQCIWQCIIFTLKKQYQINCKKDFRIFYQILLIKKIIVTLNIILLF